MALRFSSRSSQVLAQLGALFLLLALGYLLYAPPAALPRWSYFGTSDDPLIYVWFLNWWPYALMHHLPLMWTNFIDAPFGAHLAWKTGIIGLAMLALPVTLHYGAFAAYNGLMLIAPGLAGWAAYLAAAELTSDAGAALAAGLVFGFSGYMLEQMRDHLNLAFIASVPFCLWLCIAAARHGWPRWRLAVPLGFTLAFTFTVSQEVFASLVFFGFAGIILALLADRPVSNAMRGLCPGIFRGLGLGILLVSPLIWEMLRNYKDAAASASSAAQYASDLLGFVVPPRLIWAGGGFFAPVTAQFKARVEGNGCYIGLPLLALLWHIWRGHRRLPAIRLAAYFALLAAMLSLGPYLLVLGRWIGTAPWILAYRLPFLGSMLPIRFALYMWLGIAMMLAVWLAAPGRSWRRYALLAACLVFLFPNQGVARHWSVLTLPPMLADGTIAPGTRLMILPEGRQGGPQMGLQYAAGMRFSLVGEGYLGNGSPQPFARWPLYEELFHLDAMGIDPAMLRAFLATYQPQDIIVLAGPNFAALTGLLRQAGWRPGRMDGDAMLFLPPPDQMPPSNVQVAQFLRQIPPNRRIKMLGAERKWVQALCFVSQTTGLKRETLFAVYAAHDHLLLPPGAIGCDP